MKPTAVVRYFGGQVAAAEALGITQPAISAWVRQGEIPWLRQLQIERITEGQLKASKPRGGNGR